MAEQSPFSGAALAFGILLANMAIVFATAPIQFYPSNLAINLGLLYGTLCAAFHAFATRRAANRIASLSASQKRLLDAALPSKAVIGVALVQLVFGAAAFSNGASAIYSMMNGHAGVASTVVASVKRKTRPTNCFKHSIAGHSLLLNLFYAPCISKRYAPGSRFVYVGRESALGIQYSAVTVEADGIPRHAGGD